MYARPEPEVRNPSELLRLVLCPASIGSPRSKESPALRDNASPHLLLWQVVRDAAEYLQSSDSIDPMEALGMFGGGLDPVHRHLAGERLRGWVAVMGDEEHIRFTDSSDEPHRVVDPSGLLAIHARPTAVVHSPDGHIEYLKLRTGRSRTSPEEAAVLLGGAPEDGDVIDVVVDPNDVDSILVTLDGRDWNEVIEPMVGAWHEANQRRDKPQPMPSRDACTTGCRRPAFCGAFPTVGERRPGSNARLIMASKSNLANVTRCERRAAWALVHGIPRQRDDDSANRTSLGITAHQILASLVLSSDPLGELEQHLEGVLSEDRATVRMFLEHHLGIDEEHDGPIAYRRSEFLIGMTVVVPGYYPGRPEDQGDVAVVLYGLADAVGYEADSTPAIVDHKTTDYEPAYEQDLYAVALAAAFGPGTDRVAVHHHYLGRPESPRCVRSEFGAVELEEATARLRQVAVTIAGWDPLAPSEVAPKQTADGDCVFCPFRDRCGTFGGPQPQ